MGCGQQAMCTMAKEQGLLRENDALSPMTGCVVRGRIEDEVIVMLNGLDVWVTVWMLFDNPARLFNICSNTNEVMASGSVRAEWEDWRGWMMQRFFLHSWKHVHMAESAWFGRHQGRWYEASSPTKNKNRCHLLRGQSGAGGGMCGLNGMGLASWIGVGVSVMVCV